MSLSLQSGIDFFGIKKLRNEKQLTSTISDNLNRQKNIINDYNNFFDSLKTDRDKTVAQELGSAYSNTLSRTDSNIKKAQAGALIRNAQQGGNLSSAALNIATQGEATRMNTLQDTKQSLENQAINQKTTNISNTLNMLKTLQAQLQNERRQNSQKKSGFEKLTGTAVDLGKRFLTGGLI